MANPRSRDIGCAERSSVVDERMQLIASSFPTRVLRTPIASSDMGAPFAARAEREGCAATSSARVAVAGDETCIVRGDGG